MNLLASCAVLNSDSKPPYSAEKTGSTPNISTGSTQSRLDAAQQRNQQMIQQQLQMANELKQADDYRAQGKLVEAEALYQQILTLVPDNPRAIEGLQLIAIMQNHAMMLSNAQIAFDKQDTTTAQTILRSILAEDSGYKPARELFETIERQNIAKVTEQPQIVCAFKKTITLSLKNVPIKSVFEYLSQASRLNFSYDQALPSDLQTSIFVRDTTIEEAIDVILDTNQLGKKVLNKNTLLIYPLSREQEYQEQYVRSFYLSHLDTKRAMNLIKTVVKSKDVYIDEKLNTLIMRDNLKAIQMAEKLIASQDLEAPEVMLEVEVMEINRRNLAQIGIQLPGQVSIDVQGNAAGNSSATPIAGQLSLAELKHFNGGLGVFTLSDPALVLNLLQQNTDTNLLANPKIRVKNRDKAKIHVGDKIPVLTSVANSTGFVSQTVSYIDVGIKLDVEPTIMLQNQVNIKVGLEVSNVTDQVRTDTGVLAYTIGSRNATTTLQLKDNETQILAGLFKDDAQRIVRKVPGLSSLPIIGKLFTNNNDDQRKNEIVLLITPHILHNISPVDAVYSVFPSGINHDVRSGGQSGPGQANGASPQPDPANNVTPVTPQAINAERIRTDQDFANQILQPGAAPEGENSNMIYKAQ